MAWQQQPFNSNSSHEHRIFLCSECHEFLEPQLLVLHLLPHHVRRGSKQRCVSLPSIQTWRAWCSLSQGTRPERGREHESDRALCKGIDPLPPCWQPLQRCGLTVIKRTYTRGWFQTQIFGWSHRSQQLSGLGSGRRTLSLVSSHLLWSSSLWTWWWCSSSPGPFPKPPRKHRKKKVQTHKHINNGSHGRNS